jgi:hypothetical protein
MHDIFRELHLQIRCNADEQAQMPYWSWHNDGICLPPHLVAGVDEVGRGPLVGAVVTAAVILDPARPIIGLNDSKNYLRNAVWRCLTRSKRKRWPGVWAAQSRTKSTS